MKVPYREDVATHSDPESCVRIRKGVREALTGASVGRVLSSETEAIWDADAVQADGRQHRARRQSQGAPGPTESKTPSTRRDLVHGSREIPQLVARNGLATRDGNPKGAIRR